LQTQQVMADQSYITRDVVTSLVNGATVTREYKHLYDSAGTPQRMEYTERGANPNDVKTWIATFDSKSAFVTYPDGSTAKIDRPDGAATNDPANPWFIIIKKPTPGTEYQVCDFSISQLAWQSSTRQYVGVDPVEVEGQTINAYHEVDVESDGTKTDRFFDADGNTLREYATNGYSSERVPD